MKEYYLDTCIWLNIFKKEGDPNKGIPYWKIARVFLEKIAESGNRIIISTIVLKELYFTLGNSFKIAEQFFKTSEFIKIIKTTEEDYALARKLEGLYGDKIGFYDYLHIAIAKRLGIHLITRDKELIKFARKYVKTSKPEDLIR